MTVVPLLLFCSLLLVALAIVLFVVSARQGDCSEAERLSLLPLDDDAGAPRPAIDSRTTVQVKSENLVP